MYYPCKLYLQIEWDLIDYVSLVKDHFLFVNIKLLTNGSETVVKVSICLHSTNETMNECWFVCFIITSCHVEASLNLQSNNPGSL